MNKFYLVEKHCKIKTEYKLIGKVTEVRKDKNKNNPCLNILSSLYNAGVEVSELFHYFISR